MLAVQLDRLRCLAEETALSHRSAGVNWRPWVCQPILPDVLATYRASGAVGFSCGQIDVAESLLAAGEASVTLTRPPIGGDSPARLARLARMMEVTVICEHFAQIEPLAIACTAAGSQIQLLLNIDSGRHRLGIRPGPDLSDLLEGLQTLTSVSVVGLALESSADNIEGTPPSAEHQLAHLLDAAQRSFTRVGHATKEVSLGRLRELGELGGIEIEARSTLPVGHDGPFAILTTIIGRPTRDVAVIDACAMHLAGVQRGNVISSEAHFHEIRNDGAVLFLCGSAQDLLIGDLVAILVTTRCFPWAASVAIGEQGRWRFSEPRLG
jgi:D-serine deaminase-like pyridoxal phosphate-dependent protein